MLTVYVVLKGISATQLIVALIAIKANSVAVAVVIIKANSVAVAVVIVAEVTFESYSVVLCTLVLV